MHVQMDGWMDGWREQHTAKRDDIKYEASPNTKHINDNRKQITEQRS